MRITPYQLDHAFKSTTTIEVITMQFLWPDHHCCKKVCDPVTILQEIIMLNDFTGEYNTLNPMTLQILPCAVLLLKLSK